MNIERFLKVSLTRDAESIIKYYNNYLSKEIKLSRSNFGKKTSNIGDFLIFFGNNSYIDITESVSLVCNNYKLEDNILMFFENIYNDCSELYGDVISHTLLLDVFKRTYSFYIKKIPLEEIMNKLNGENWSKNIPKENIPTFENSLFEIFNFFLDQCPNLLFMTAKNYLDFLIMAGEEKEQKLFIGDMIVNMYMNSFEVSYKVFSGIKNNEICFFDLYEFSNGISILLFDFMDCIKEKVKIKSCENCGKYFIPVSKSNEIYCDNIYKNKKTCRQVGYEHKLNNNDILKAYRTAYKSQNAKKHRNKHRVDIDERFKKWHLEARNRLEDAKIGKIDIEEFKTWLKNDWWLK